LKTALNTAQVRGFGRNEENGGLDIIRGPMTLLVLDDISLDIGDQPLLRHAALTLEPNERVCLIGRNGAGKSTLLRITRSLRQADFWLK
jgi:ABC-type molybdenum transport system ATPase subunit/photorepair protein PhrA